MEIAYNVQDIDRYIEPFAESNPVIESHLKLALNRALRKYKPNLRRVRELPDNAPEWMKQKWLTGERNFMEFVPDSTLDGSVSHIAHWIKAAVVNDEPWLKEVDSENRPRRLLEIGSLEVAISKADKAMKRGHGVIEEVPGDTHTVMELNDGFRIVELMTTNALDREGQMLKHCIGDGAFDDKLGITNKYYSLRDKNNKGCATFEVEKNGHVLKQCKGKQNQPPAAKYMPYARIFIEQERFNLHENASHTGFMQDTNGCRYDIYNLPAELTIEDNLNLNKCKGIKTLPDNLVVGGILNLDYCTGLTVLPKRLRVGSHFDMMHCTGITALPDDMQVEGDISIEGCTGITILPKKLRVECNFYAGFCTGLKALPQGLTVLGDLDLIGCTSLTELPKGLKVGGHLYLKDCTGLKVLPNRLKVDGYLDLTGCTGLTALPTDLRVDGDLNMAGCTGLTSLPQGLQVNGNLDLTNCTGLRALPKDMEVNGKIIGWKPDISVTESEHNGGISHPKHMQTPRNDHIIPN